ncbi:MAG: carboxypeptidase regulatory-like domain-containing protein [Candidatus Competibacteraceae bacterium]
MFCETIRHRAAIGGYVVDACSNRPIAGAAVTLADQGLQMLTREDGFFYFIDIPSGQYTLHILAPELGSRYGAVTVSNLTVANDPEGRPIFDGKANVGLPPTRLAGHVVRADNQQPIQGATVGLRASAIKTTTNKQGEFAFSAVEAGTQTMQALAPGFTTLSRLVSLSAGQEATVDISLTPS